MQQFVYISGNTNISQFELSLEFPARQVFQVVLYDSSYRKNELYNISIPVNHFEANNKLIYNDFITLLKTDQYPDIIIKIPYAHLLNVFSGMLCTKHMINITIAGITNSYIIPGSASFCAGDKLYVTGIKNIRLTDFNLNPPEKLKGLIKVEDEVIIDFGFVFLVKKKS